MNRSWLQTALILALIAIGSSAHAKKDSRCAAQNELDENLVNPIGIKSYVQTNKIKSLDDLVCCLPESYRSNYVIGHSSIAGQNGSPHSPRVLLFNQLREVGGTKSKGPLRSVLTINGGDPNLNQSQNLEMMYNNPQTHEVEYYDLDFAENTPRLSGKNPTLCASCHGVDGAVGTGGAHPNFDPPFAWRRFVNGVATCNESEGDYQQALTNATEKPFRKNPRFKCLSKNVDGVDPFGNSGQSPSPVLLDLDIALAKLNDRRTAKIIQASANYARYKYVIIGSQLCQFDSSPKNFELGKWLPPAIIASLNSRRGLATTVVNSTDFSRTLKTEFTAAGSRTLQVASRMKQAVPQLRAGQMPDFLKLHDLDSCGPTDKENDDARVQQDESPTTGVDLADRYALDTTLEAGSPKPQLALLRYLFESRGIDIGDWSMQPTTHEYQRNPIALDADLLSEEPSLKAMYGKLLAAHIFENDGTTFKNPAEVKTEETLKRKACAELQTLSWKAFSPATSLPLPAPVVDQRLVR